MAEVTGFTADRMLAMEDATVIDARLETDNLVLTTKGGTDIDVGSVRGSVGPVGPPVTALNDIGDVDVGTVGDGDKLGFDVASGMWVPVPKDYLSVTEYNEVDDQVVILNRQNNPDTSKFEGSGILQLGASGATNMALDNDEIQVRDGLDGPGTMFIQGDGGDLQVGGSNRDPDEDLTVAIVSNANLLVDIRADADDSNEAHNPTLRLSQDGGGVETSFLIDSANYPRLTTNWKWGGPYMQWELFNNIVSGRNGNTIVDSAVYRCGNLALFRLNVLINNPISSSGTGNFANTVIAAANSNAMGNGPGYQSLSIGASGPLCSVIYSPSTGEFQLCAGIPGVQYQGEQISFGGIVVVDMP